jgi:hypothetical protein
MVKSKEWTSQASTLLIAFYACRLLADQHEGTKQFGGDFKILAIGADYTTVVGLLYIQAT